MAERARRDGAHASSLALRDRVAGKAPKWVARVDARGRRPGKCRPVLSGVKARRALRALARFAALRGLDPASARGSWKDWSPAGQRSAWGLWRAAGARGRGVHVGPLPLVGALVETFVARSSLRGALGREWPNSVGRGMAALRSQVAEALETAGRVPASERGPLGRTPRRHAAGAVDPMCLGLELSPPSGT